MSKDENDESEVKNGEEGHTKKLRSKAASNRMNVATTLEKNTSALNATRLENEYFVDPMFQKMSKAFDEGGAKGMLMNNIVSF
jgi:condensin complex subunit 2